jgi:hypothetical protein
MTATRQDLQDESASIPSYAGKNIDSEDGRVGIGFAYDEHMAIVVRPSDQFVHKSSQLMISVPSLMPWSVDNGAEYPSVSK